MGADLSLIHISKGLALGASSHAIGTAKAIEIGEIEGAMSSLAIAVAGILTAVSYTHLKESSEPFTFCTRRAGTSLF